LCNWQIQIWKYFLKMRSPSQYLQIIFIGFLIICDTSCKKANTEISSCEIALATSQNLNAIHFITDSIGVIGGGQKWGETVMYTTFDAGTTWQQANWNLNKTGAITCIKTLKNNSLLAIGFNGICYSSADSGKHWTFGQLGDYANYVGIGSTTDKIFLTTENGSIHSMDYGLQWIKTNNYGVAVQSVSMVNSNIGYVACNSGILKTSDAGNSWNFTNAIGDYYKDLIAVDENNCIAVGYNGTIIATKNGGETWQEIKSQNKLFGKNMFFNAICVTKKKEIFYAVGDKGICIKINANSQTYEVVKPFTGKHLHAICALPNNILMVAAESGLLFKLKIN
jgi:photosystem II stability/assembly factor-like uncharacterized protein